MNTRRKPSGIPAGRSAVLSLILVLACLFAFAPTLSTQAAAKEYTISFRPGNIGDGFSASLVENYKAQFGKAKVTETANGALKVTAAQGTEIPVPSATQVRITGDNASKYFFTGFSYTDAQGNTAKTGQSVRVEKNADYVADYARLVEGVEYAIAFVNEAGIAVAPQEIAYANVGDQITYTANTVFEPTGHQQYRLLGEATKTLVLSEKEEKNVILFT
jgi:hypothetical protein